MSRNGFPPNRAHRVVVRVPGNLDTGRHDRAFLTRLEQERQSIYSRNPSRHCRAQSRIPVGAANEVQHPFLRVEWILRILAFRT